jgi:hypothetical protein
MARTRYRIAAMTVLMIATTAAHGQQEIEWKQTFAMPKGQNLPSGLKLDILGIEAGDSYAEVKPKLEKLQAEAIPPKPDNRTMMQKSIAEMQGARDETPLVERKNVFNMTMPGSSTVTAASYVAMIRLQRRMKGSTERTIEDNLAVALSAPSSGHQVIGVKRSLRYYNQSDEPRISEIVAQLKAKFKSEPQVFALGRTTEYLFQYNDGQAFASRNATASTCLFQYDVAVANLVPQVNRNGECDVVLKLTAVHGISGDHAESLIFELSDNERAKANVGADFAFMQNYLTSLQERTRGAPPKL